VDLNGDRKEVLASVQEIRRLETSRGQPCTPILGISNSDDALADLDAINQGCSDVHRGSSGDPALTHMLNRLIKGALQAA
jgi:hypothetical protein